MKEFGRLAMNRRVDAVESREENDASNSISKFHRIAAAGIRVYLLGDRLG